MAINIENVHGRNTFYGPTTATHQFGADISGADGVVYKELEFTAADFPTETYAAGNNMFGIIPAHSAILEVNVHVIEAFAAGTLNVGLYDAAAGTAVDADGLVAAQALTAVGWFAGAGLLVGDETGAADAVLVGALAAVTGTAGKVRVTVKYAVGSADAGSFGGPDVIPSTF